MRCLIALSTLGVLAACKTKPSDHAPAIAIDAAKITVDGETIPDGQLRARNSFAGAATVTISPQLSAERALAGLRTLAEAGFVSLKVAVGTETLSLDVASPGGAPVDVIEVAEPTVTTWITANGCSVIMTSDPVTDFSHLPVHFGFESLADSKNDVHVIIRPRSRTTAADLTTPLRHLLASTVVSKHHGKLRFDWVPVSCPYDGKWGHAN